MELQLDLALSFNSSAGSSKHGSDYCSSLKRRRQCFDVDKSREDALTLPLLSWSHNNQPNEEEDINNDEMQYYSSTEAADGMVGWPPIKSWRKNNQRLLAAGAGNRRRSSKYVKVKMEGVAIARKIDLTRFTSLPPLLTTLLTMFGRGREEEEDDDDQFSNYVITYQDKEGDWLLAHQDDVPWRLFVESVQRLKLQKNLLE